jgi:Na+/H+-translocating membrane pyrophosphatase
MMVGIAAIIGAIVSILVGLVLSTLTSFSPLIIGGIVGGISVVPLIAALITTPPSTGPHNRNMSDSLKAIMCLGGLFTGSIITGIGLVAYGVTPIIKVDSLLSLSTTANSLLSIGVIALLFPIVAAIGVGIAIKLAGVVKKYISNKQTKPPEEEPRPPQQIKPERLPDSELSEVNVDEHTRTSATNSPQ